MHPQLAVDLPGVTLHRVLGQYQRLSDLAVGETFFQAGKEIPLAAGQWLDREKWLNHVCVCYTFRTAVCSLRVMNSSRTARYLSVSSTCA